MKKFLVGLLLLCSLAGMAQEVSTRLRPRDRFYNRCGEKSLYFLSPGYSYCFANAEHYAQLNTLEFRSKLFGMSLLEFEMQVNPVSTWFAYRPNMKIYIPFGRWIGMTVYGGASVDLTYLGQYFIKGYEFDSDNFFVNAFGGASLLLVPFKCLPIEIKAEYRYPLINNIQPQGVYLTTQLHLGTPIHKKHTN